MLDANSGLFEFCWFKSWFMYRYITLTSCMHMHQLSNSGTKATGAESESLAIYDLSHITKLV